MIDSDVGELAPKLAPQDMRELELLDCQPFSTLAEGYNIGSYVGLVNGVPEAAFGVNRDVYPAAIWFLGSREARRHVRDFMAISHRWVELMTRDGQAANIVPAENRTTIRWLKALDFEFEDQVYTINGHAFLRFYRGPLSTSLLH